jgi:hypothetical protein
MSTIKELAVMLVNIFGRPYYPYKVYLTTILGAPILNYLLAVIFNSNSATDFFLGSLVMITFGALLSLPSLVIYYIAFRLLCVSNIKYLFVKVYSALIACFLFMVNTAPFTSFQFSNSKSISFVGAYCLTVIVASLLYKIDRSFKHNS